MACSVPVPGSTFYVHVCHPVVPYLFLGLQDVQWIVGNSHGARKLARTPHVNKKNNNKKKKTNVVSIIIPNSSKKYGGETAGADVSHFPLLLVGGYAHLIFASSRLSIPAAVMLCWEFQRRKCRQCLVLTEGEGELEK
jgi:hypothetical protein